VPPGEDVELGPELVDGDSTSRLDVAIELVSMHPYGPQDFDGLLLGPRLTELSVGVSLLEDIIGVEEAEPPGDVELDTSLLGGPGLMLPVELISTHPVEPQGADGVVLGP
jgi:hypothetical protein